MQVRETSSGPIRETSLQNEFLEKMKNRKNLKKKEMPKNMETKLYEGPRRKRATSVIREFCETRLDAFGKRVYPKENSRKPEYENQLKKRTPFPKKNWRLALFVSSRNEVGPIRTFFYGPVRKTSFFWKDKRKIGRAEKIKGDAEKYGNQIVRKTPHPKKRATEVICKFRKTRLGPFGCAF